LLAVDVQTGAAVNASTGAPPAGQMWYITQIVIKMDQSAAQAGAPFDMTITGLEPLTPGTPLTHTIPMANPGAINDVAPTVIPFTHPVRAAGAVAVAGTPTANTRVSAAIYGFAAP
jgi:hypothetical protein